MNKRVLGLGSVLALVLVGMLGYAQLARTGPLPVCGNAAVEAGEECDDSNTVGGDGCNAACLIEGPLSKTQQVCVNGVNATFASAITASNTASTKCVKNLSKGTIGGTFAQCVGGADFSASSAKAGSKNNNACVAKGVVPANTFAYAGDPASLVFAAIFQTASGYGDLLGDPTAIAPSTATAASLCQKTVVTGYAKYVNALAKQTNKAKKASLKDKFSPPLTSLELQADLIVAADSPKVAGALSSLKTKAAAKCSGQILAALFPGACATSSASAAALGDCAGKLGRCRYCLALNDTDHLQLDCEAYSGLALCPPPAPVGVCGDGDLDPGEDCDDSNTVDGDGCDALCQDEVCGNGQLQTGSGEECDDSNTVSGDGCSSLCLIEECGDGVLNPQEECDDSNTVSGDGCTALCEDEFCGDGVEQIGEECDDSNTVGGDGCSANCEDEGVGTPVGGFQWFLGSLGNSCSTVCSSNALGYDDLGTRGYAGSDGTDPQCDGVLTALGAPGANPLALTCPDGWGCIVNGGSTRFRCTSPGTNASGSDGNQRRACACNGIVCGNGHLEAGEDCDDGNTTSQDACSSACQDEFCGDGVLQPAAGELCDDSNTVSGDGCSSTCIIEI